MAGQMATFRARLKAREHMLGTFVKMPTTQAIEIIGSVGYEFVVIDQEHAPLDRATTDLMIFSARASGMAALVRVGDASDANILSALDCGATGIMVPHVSSAARAGEIVRACRYGGGGRGFAGLTRASRWGSVAGPAHMKAQDAEVTFVAMIEDAAAVDIIDEIVGVEGLDAVFIGRGDLTASFGDDPDAAAKVAELSRRIAAAAKKADVPLMMLATSKNDAITMRSLGAASLLVASDHNFLRSAASTAFKEYTTLPA